MKKIIVAFMVLFLISGCTKRVVVYECECNDNIEHSKKQLVHIHNEETELSHLTDQFNEDFSAIKDERLENAGKEYDNMEDEANEFLDTTVDFNLD